MKPLLLLSLMVLVGGTAWANCHSVMNSGKCEWKCTDISDDVVGIPSCEDTARPSWVKPYKSDCSNDNTVYDVRCVDHGKRPCGYTCGGMGICDDIYQGNACLK